MSVVGAVESLWRYPVKSMRGEELDEIFAGFAGVYGDRLFAFESSANRKGFPFFTGRDERQMIRYKAQFRNPEKAARPRNLSEAEKANANPITADPSDLMIDVETPDRKTFPIDHPALIDSLRANVDGSHNLRLIRSDKAMTDCRPLSIFAVQSAKKLGEEIDLARAESVDMNRVIPLDVLHQVEIPLEGDVRIVAALNQNLHAAKRFGLIDFRANLLV